MEPKRKGWSSKYNYRDACAVEFGSIRDLYLPDIMEEQAEE